MPPKSRPRNEEENNFLHGMIKQYVVGQQRTVGYRQFVFLDGDRVIKGPYKKERAELISHRSHVLGQIGTGQHFVLVSGWFNVGQDYYLIFPNIDPYDYRDHTEQIYDKWTGQTLTVLKRNGPAVIAKLSHYLKEHFPLVSVKWIMAQMNTFLYDLILLYILGVGDSGTANILVNESAQKIYIIDYDEIIPEEFERPQPPRCVFYFKQTPAKKIEWCDATMPFYPEMKNSLLTRLSTNAVLDDPVFPRIRERFNYAIEALTMHDTTASISYSTGLSSWSNFQPLSGSLPISTSTSVFSNQPAYLTGAFPKTQTYSQDLPTSLSTTMMVPTAATIPATTITTSTTATTTTSTREIILSPYYHLVSLRKREIVPGFPEWSEIEITTFPAGVAKFVGRSASKTAHGYTTGLVKSSLQKSVRRSFLPEGWYAAFDLYSFMSIPEAKGIITNLYNRLAVIATEDIGPANTGLVIDVLDIVLEKNRAPELLASAVGCMCHSSHTRIMSHYWSVYGNVLRHEKARNHGFEIDPYQGENYEMIVERFSLALSQKSPQAFTWYGYYIYFRNQVVENKQPLPKVKITAIPNSEWRIGRITDRPRTTSFEVRFWEALVPYLSPLVCGYLARAYFEIKENRPFISMAIVLAISSPREDYTPSLLRKIAPSFITPELQALVEGRYLYQPSEVSYDKHTAEGLRLHADRQKFVHEGAVVVNQSEKYNNPALEAFYKLD